jgi:hypothetical protein
VISVVDLFILIRETKEENTINIYAQYIQRVAQSQLVSVELISQKRGEMMAEKE